jgi:anaphase-promoting complex subunit 4
MNQFTCLGTLHLPSQSRLLSSACCPDKDLVVLISRLAGQECLSLWNYSQGTKIWEVNLEGDEGESTEVVDAVWSPDGDCFIWHNESLASYLHSNHRAIDCSGAPPVKIDHPFVARRILTGCIRCL